MTANKRKSVMADELFLELFRLRMRLALSERLSLRASLTALIAIKGAQHIEESSAAILKGLERTATELELLYLQDAELSHLADAERALLADEFRELVDELKTYVISYKEEIEGNIRDAKK